MALQKIKFQTNIPVELALKFPEGKLCDSQFGDPQYMFTTTDERVFFVADKVAQKIHGLRLQPQEPFDITKAEVDYGNGRKGIEWQVVKVGLAPGNQPDGTSVVASAQPGAGAATPAPVATAVKQSPSNNGNGTRLNGHPNGKGNGNANAVTVATTDPPMAWAQFLLLQTNALVDVYFHALDYASENYGNAVKAEDVRALMTTAFINASKSGGANVA